LPKDLFIFTGYFYRFSIFTYIKYFLSNLKKLFT